VNPLATSGRIEQAYRRYLVSTFAPTRADLRDGFSRALASEFPLSRGPFLQASAPFETGASIADLINDGVLARAFERMPHDSFPISRPLYHHQDQAIRKAVVGRRNLVVATGTGSGKTETFLIPTLEGLFREAERGTLGNLGVRALLLYPMNALANDQLRRLRRLLRQFPEITFGRYVGETVHERAKAEDDFRTRYPHEPRVPNELISREAMQERPPHILLTNYAMLEFLLLRPEDSPLFESGASTWRQIALDEAHVYDGADGAEVAMLLRRLRDRVVGSERGRLQCFATSATLGSGEADFPDLVAFASTLFDESFEWDLNDVSRQDVVRARRLPIAAAAGSEDLPRGLYAAIRDVVDSDDRIESLHRVLETQSLSVLPSGSTVDAALVDLFTADGRLTRLQQALAAGTIELPRAAEVAFGDPSAIEDVIALVELAVRARREPEDAPLLPARYHFFIRALEGGFLCLHSRHPEPAPRVRLSRHRTCPDCAETGLDSRAFEFGTCRRCGASYLVGLQVGDRLEPAPPFARLTYLLLENAATAADEDESEADEGGIEVAEGRRYLCPGCGRLSGDSDSACGCGSDEAKIPVLLVKPSGERTTLGRCAACSASTPGEIVYRFVTGQDAPVAVIGTSLYQDLPASDDPDLSGEVGEGRKLLVFSDSRQDAAFFAPYLEGSYGRAVQRGMIRAAAERGSPTDPFRLDDLVAPVLREAERSLVLDPDAGRQSNLTAVRTWLLREVTTAERRISLDGSGVLEIRLALPRRYQPPRALLDLGFAPDEATDLIRVLLDSVRLSAAVTMPDGVDIRSDEFAPRNREYAIRGTSPEPPEMLSWAPGSNSNRRLDYLTKVFARRGIASDPRVLLLEMWDYLTAPASDWDGVLVAGSDRRGPWWRLSHERFEFVPLADDHLPRRCSRCRQLWWRSVADACPAFRCDGTLAGVTQDEIVTDHYARLNLSLAPIGMSVAEHTAQWRQAAGSAIQQEFMRGRINVLSCSTTFELGVDVGDIESVLLRNVPPTPANYVQRAGRAGRRTDSAALVVTYAQRRNHDLAFFARPERMVDGIIAPPRIQLDNPTIVRRHLHSVALAAFLKDRPSLRTVSDFFEPVDEGGPAAVADFRTWLEQHPPDLGAAMTRVTPPNVQGEVGTDDWAWVAALFDPSDADPTFGWLGRADAEVRDDLAELDAAVAEAVAAEQFRAADAYRLQQATMRRTRLLNFLARRNVLPKYGFPVDVVPLDLARTGDRDAARLELDRDLRVAISEYAPGGEVVAAKAVWTSLGLKTQVGRAWPSHHWAICRVCGAYREGLTEVAAECPVCGSTDVDPMRNGRYVIPVFGFVGQRAKRSPGESRPGRVGTTETFFSDYKEGDFSTFEEAADLFGPAGRVEVRVSRQGRLTVLNRGPMGRGFQLCTRCGYGEPAPLPGAAGRGRRRAGHRDIRRAVGRDCNNWLEAAQLGHEFLTDVVEIRTSAPMSAETARSALYALLEGAARALSIKRDEIDGTLRRWDRYAPEAFVIFDNVPGGAGHAQRIGKDLATVVRAAIARVETCECDAESSCYTCLRTYSNQLYHDSLNRGDALRALRALLPES
jgi:ATP-dependent helicase YprA (DUF1998 family)